MDTVLTIDRESLRRRLASNEGVKLVDCLSKWAFEHKRIPGSLHFDSPEEMLRSLRKDDEIVVYCSNVACRASIAAYWLLVNNGFTRVRRYAAGLVDWEAAGLPLEGSWVTSTAASSQA